MGIGAAARRRAAEREEKRSIAGDRIRAEVDRLTIAIVPAKRAAGAAEVSEVGVVGCSVIGKRRGHAHAVPDEGVAGDRG